ncbi:hypothetical protein H2200_002952 [Cladophialophora chaetospira]|uniref:Uncharacterized protein n=1 Tax=Cladophialophora chaetospira TaxID=386627 RepID=A0AA39CM76_9EURO|nr:hypothetical protein H2200_002952 [Cladophialophora chaetospira]
MAGYAAAYVGLPEPQKKQTPVEVMEQIENQPTLAERRGKAWFKKLSLSIKSNHKRNRSSDIPASPQSSVIIITKEEYLNKPLPPLPSPEQAPYFEYMFADAGIKKKKSNESMKSSVETDNNSPDSDQQELVQTRPATSNGSSQSYGLDSSEITQFAFAHAGVNVSTKEIIDNHFASVGTSFEGNLDLATLAEDIEKEKATADFFGGIEAKEGPSPDHVPVVDEDGFVDRREGLEDWPQLWQSDKETLADYVVPGSEDCSIAHNHIGVHYNSNGEKAILQPKSQKNKIRPHDPSFPDSYQTVTGMITAPAVQSPVRAPRPLTIRKKNKSRGQAPNHRISKIYRVNKRSARDSFVTKSTVDGPNPVDYNINLLATKKIRVTETLADEDPSSPSRAVSVCGSITSPSSVDLTATSPSDADTELTDAPPLENDSDTFSLKRQRLTDCLTGYPGQFESYESDYLHIRATMGAVEHFTAGEPSHPNGLYTHTNFVADPTFPVADYTRAMLAVMPVRDLALQYAENMTLSHTCSDHVRALRTPTQEMMRRELHRECAAARLEGVSVGTYRYFQGFMSLAEYIGARICKPPPYQSAPNNFATIMATDHGPGYGVELGLRQAN